MASTPEWLRLEPGEEVVWTGHPRIRRILAPAAQAVLWSVGGLVAAFLVSTYVDLGISPFVLYAVALGWAGLVWFGVGQQYLQTTNTDYVMTTENLYAKTGVFSENVTRVSLDKIQNIELSKDWTGNMFDYGSIAIDTAGSGGTEMVIEDLDDPDEFRNDLRRRMSRASEAAGGDDRRAGTERPDAETLEGMVGEARKMRESAERIRRQFS